MIKKILFLLILSLPAFSVFADTVSIKDFVIMENPYARQEISISAVDTSKQIQEKVNGIFTFSINGFNNELNFQNGTAFYRHKLDKSTFMYLKHTNDAGSHSVLYYIYKHGDKLSPWRVSWIWLLIIPLIIMLAGYLFKRFIILAVIILIIFLYFNHSNGLSIPTFFESIFDGLKHSVMG